MVPLHLLVASLVGWLQGEQHKVIEYLNEENRTLKGQLHNRPLNPFGRIAGHYEVG